LLLLCDEVEELIQLNRQDPSLLRKLRRALHSRDGIRSVLASSVRLWQLADTGEDTSPFLDGFTPPLSIGPLDDDTARQLIRQTQLSDSVQPDFSDDVVERIRSQCGNHPYQIQLLCRRYLDCGDLDRAVEEIVHDRAVGFFFAVDFELLGDTDRSILRRVADREPLTSMRAHPDLSSDALATGLSTLEELGFIATGSGGEYEIRSQFLSRWLTESGDESPPGDS
jgi:hypothetical protein